MTDTLTTDTEVQNLRATVERLVHSNTALTRHLEGLGQALLEEAEQRGWCDQYDEFAEKWDLPQRKKVYVVTMTVTVNAVNEEAATDLVSSNVGVTPYDITDVSDMPEFSAVVVH